MYSCYISDDGAPKAYVEGDHTHFTKEVTDCGWVKLHVTLNVNDIIQNRTSSVFFSFFLFFLFSQKVWYEYHSCQASRQ